MESGLGVSPLKKADQGSTTGTLLALAGSAAEELMLVIPRWRLPKVEQGIESDLVARRLPPEKFKILMHAIPKRDRTDVRRALGEARLRTAKYNCRVELIGFPVRRFSALIIGGVAMFVSLASPGNGDPSLAWFGGLIFFTSFRLLYLAFNAGWRKHVPSLEGATPLKIRLGELFGTQARLGLVGVALAVGGTVTLVHRHGWLITTERESLGVGVALVIGGIIIVTEVAIEAIVFRADEPHVLDKLIVETAFIVVTMTEMAPAWRRADVSRYFIDRFEHLAATVDNLPMARRIPLPHVGLHSKVHHPVKRLSSVIRAHKRAIAEVASREAYDRILNSLVVGFMAMVREDWPVLLANAETVKSRRWYLGYVAKNLVPALVLASVAIVLPWLPPFRGHMASLLGIRITLGLYAVLRLIPRTSLTDLVDRGLSRGFDPLKGK